jgi:hypothetical protein
MGNAGFQDIKILEQTGFPIDVVTINPKTMELVKQMGVPLKDLKDFTGSVVSIKVEAIKK